MTKRWINFYSKKNGKKLGGFTQEGSHRGEIKATRELIAYDNNIKTSDIEIRYETK